MKHAANIALLSQLKPDYMGFIFYKKSPRYVHDVLPPSVVSDIPKSIKKTGVFVNATRKDILSMADLYQLDAIQLHGQESPDFCQDLKELGYIVLKAFHLKNENDIYDTSKYEEACDFFLFDTPSDKHGGTGQKFNWQLLEAYKGSCPYFISGGIGPEDADSIKNLTSIRPMGLDINSRFEWEPGLKNIEAIKTFIEQLDLSK
jgi:phosphoribosylanthranilate isomerase